MNALERQKTTTKIGHLLNAVTDVEPIVVFGNGMLPVFRHGDCLMASPSATIKPGDRVVAKVADGKILGGTLLYRNNEQITIAPYSSSKRDFIIGVNEIEFLGRVIWASQ